MSLNPIARELNAVIKNANPHIIEMFSKTGKRLFFPKGILSQAAEAKEKARPEFNATIGIATENLGTMHLPSVVSGFDTKILPPENTLPYAPSFGILELRKVWKDNLYKKNPSLIGKSISLPVVTNGITHAISVFADMFLDPDDVVIFPDKMWGNNNLIMTVRKDARIAQYAMFNDQGGFNIEAFENCARKEAETNSKITVPLNFPNNPTGYTINEKEADQIVAILSDIAENGTNVITISDDAYFGLFYEDDPIKESIFSKLCDIHPRVLAIKMDGATKEMFVWGLRVGFITYGTVFSGEERTFYEALEKKTAGNIRGAISNGCHLSQTIVLNALKSENMEKERLEKVAVLKKRANMVKKVLKNPDYEDMWEIYPFNSGYFMCLRLKTVEAEPLRQYLLEKYKIGLISTGKYDIRIAFSSVDEENIPVLFDLLYRGVKDMMDR